MTHHLARPSPRTGIHLLLGALAVAAVTAVVLRPSVVPVVGGLALGSVALHVGALGLLFLGLKLHTGGGSSVGSTLHSARLYDGFVGLYTLGREARLRAQTLDAAAVAAGDAVLDVCCGTGTLTLAARERVGARGSARGVDASPEMIARARTKAGSARADVPFDVAPAQALPFPDAAFDVVLCSLGFHHLPEDAREPALAEMRRVLRPGGRLVIAEFVHGHGILSKLNPAAWWRQTHDRHLVDEAAAALTRAGFVDVTTGALALREVGYARGVKPGSDAPS